MADNGINKVRNWILTITSCVVLASMFAGGVLAWGDLGAKIDNQAVVVKNQADTQSVRFNRVIYDANELETKGCEPAKEQKTQFKQVVKDVNNLKAEGCKPAQKNKGSISIIEYRLDEMQITQRAIQSDTREILKRLPK